MTEYIDKGKLIAQINKVSTSPYDGWYTAGVLESIGLVPVEDVLTKQEAHDIIMEAARKLYADAGGNIMQQREATGMKKAAKLFK